MKRALAILATIAAGLAASSVDAQALLNNNGHYSLKVVSYRDLPFRTVVRQQFDYSCGSAALATLLRHHYGRDVDEQTVFQAMFDAGNQESIRRVGFSLLDMKRYLATHGYDSDGFRMTLDELVEEGSPAILMIDPGSYRHFVVFKGADADRVLVGDPAQGLKVYSHEEFKAMWNGVAFMVHDPAERVVQAGEWEKWTEAPVREALPNASLVNLTLQLPPLYQISTTFLLQNPPR